MKALAAVAVLFFSAADAVACSCVEAPLQTYFRESAAVFSGKVLAVKESWKPSYGRVGVTAKVMVLESWKGVRPKSFIPQLRLRFRSGPGADWRPRSREEYVTELLE